MRASEYTRATNRHERDGLRHAWCSSRTVLKGQWWTEALERPIHKTYQITHVPLQHGFGICWRKEPPDSFWFHPDLGEAQVGKTKIFAGFFILPLARATPTGKEKLVPLPRGSFVCLPPPPSAFSLRSAEVRVGSCHSDCVVRMQA